MLSAVANNGTMAVGEGRLSENDEIKGTCKSMLDSGHFLSAVLLYLLPLL